MHYRDTTLTNGVRIRHQSTMNPETIIEALHLHAEGMPKNRIAMELGIARNTVRAWVRKVGDYSDDLAIAHSTRIAPTDKVRSKKKPRKARKPVKEAANTHFETRFSNGAVICHHMRVPGGDIAKILRRIAKGWTYADAVKGTGASPSAAIKWRGKAGWFDETIRVVRSRPTPLRRDAAKKKPSKPSKQNGECHIRAWHSTIRNCLAAGYVWEEGADPYYQILTMRDGAGFVVDELHVPRPALASFRRAVERN